MINIERHFPVRFFADSDVNKILKESEQKVAIIYKTKESASIYSTFNEDISTFLMKLPSGYVKEQVQNIMNKDLLYLGLAVQKINSIFARLLITNEEKLAGICLLASQLGIDVENGTSDSPDECVYAIYFELCRAAVLLNKSAIRQDKDLHKLLSTYVYIVLMKTLGPDKVFTEKAKTFVHMVAIYLYYRYYLKEKHAYVLTIIERDYKDFLDEKAVKEFLPTLDKMSMYDSIKDFPKMLIEMKLYQESPNNFILTLLRSLKPIAFYSFMGSLDYLVALAVTSKYPIDLLSKKAVVNEKIQNSIEEIIVKYMNQIKFDLTAIPKK